MTIYICPPEIVALFDTEETKGTGREKAVEWARRFQPFSPGDRIWLPEIGWCETDNFQEEGPSR